MINAIALSQGLPSLLVSQIPVDPDGPQAQSWIIDELSKPEYQAAKPSWWDLLAKSFFDWLASLKFDFSNVPDGVFTTILLAVLVIVVIVAFFIFGVPRLRNRNRKVGELFGEHENRTSEQLRKAAIAAAESENWSLAIQEMFRATARSLDERVLVSALPGTTAMGFARLAAEVFPESNSQLFSGARSFDSVRYLSGIGSKQEFLDLKELDTQLEHSRPLLQNEKPFAASGLRT
ncbi:MAG: DUF4129 domain-containing protein [Cryobacterium sp.]|nr:DUF4129 domain-containing protein [Cryobacterium sp.]